MSEYGGTGDTLVPGKLRGYRNWRLITRNQEWTLASMNDAVSWDYNEFVASCSKHRAAPSLHPRHKENHTSPHPDCTCGIYGMYSPGSSPPSRKDSVNIWGAFDAWGKIELGTMGFRAEKAKVVAIAVPNLNEFSSPLIQLLIELIKINFAECFTKLSESYGAKLFSSKEDLIEEFPPSDISELGINNEQVIPINNLTWIPDSTRINFNPNTSATSYMVKNMRGDVVVRWTS